MRKIVVGSRQSALALTQTNQVIEALQQISEAAGLLCEFEVKKIVTKGDRILDVTLSKVGGKGLFVKEIEQALLAGEIDMAVHSMKDVPSERQEGLLIAATPKRRDPRDCMISREHRTLDELPRGARVGTSSLRRMAQLKAYRPDLVVESIRGNIDSRLNKLETEGLDAILLAAAGLERMGWQERITERLSVDLCLPAVAQGALGIECREDDDFVRKLLGRYNDAETSMTVRAERAFLRRLNGGCQVPIGAYATFVEPFVEANEASVDAVMELTGLVGWPDGSGIIKQSVSGTDPEQIGTALAEQLIALGAGELLKAVGNEAQV